jgi:hypothetical protein
MIPIIGAQSCKEYEYSIFLNIYYNPLQQENLSATKEVIAQKQGL